MWTGLGLGLRTSTRGGGGVVPIELLLTSTGDGSGVARLGMTASEDTVITLGDNAKFYSDAAGTLDESSTLTIGTTETTRYLKCTTGTATFTIADNKITRWDIADGNGWVAGTNAPSIGGSIADMTSFTYIVVNGLNTISGSVAELTSLTTLSISGTNELSGSVAALTGLTLLNAFGSNTLSGSVAALTDLTSLWVAGANTLSGDMGGAAGTVEGIKTLILNPCAMTTYSGGATWSNVAANIQPAATYGYDEDSIDNILIDMANSAGGPSSKTIRLTGSSAARTVASDAAVATLIGRGCTIITAGGTES